MQGHANIRTFAQLTRVAILAHERMLAPDMRRPLKGTSLLETLAAIALLASIAALAMPGYRRHLQRAQRADATTFLFEVYAAQQNHFLQYGRYVIAIDDVPKTPADGGLGLALISEFGQFRLSVDATEAGYLATARRVPADAADPCVRFTMDQSGLRRAFDATGTERSAECLG
jgi:type IV pilus assembly protein PilE